MGRMPDPTPTSRSDQRRAEESIGTRDLTEWDSRVGRSLTELVARAARALQPLAGRAAHWSVANLAFVLFSVVALGMMTLLTLAAHEIYENVVDADGIAGFDQPALDLALSLRGPGPDRAVTVFTDIGGPVGMPVLATVAVVVLAVTSRRWGPIVLGLIAASGSLLMTIAGKDLVGRARPSVIYAVPPFEDSPAFPSGHALNATVLTTIVVYVILLRTRSTWQRVVTISLGAVFVVAMGLSRVYLGHHWLTDVVAGWMLGLAWALLVVTAHRLHLTLSHRDEKGYARRPVAPAGAAPEVEPAVAEPDDELPVTAR